MALTNDYAFLAHDIFIKNLEKFKKKASDQDIASFKEQINNCIKSPIDLKRRLKAGNIEIFAGKLFKIRIGGRKGYRLIYFVDQDNKTIIGIYISTEKRSQFDYRKADWQRRALLICTDYDNKNYNKFQNLPSFN